MEKNNKEQQRFIDIEKAKSGKWQCPTCGQMCTKSKDWKVSADGKPLPVLIYRCSSSLDHSYAFKMPYATTAATAS